MSLTKKPNPSFANADNLDSNIKLHAQKIIYLHSTQKSGSPLVYSRQFITSHTFDNQYIAKYLANSVIDQSFDLTLSLLNLTICKYSNNQIFGLNIGSGEGVLTKIIKSRFRGINLVDIDLSYEMHRYSVANYTLLANVLNIPLGESTIDIMVSHSTIRYISDNEYARFIHETRRVLKYNGKVILTETNPFVFERFCMELCDNNIQITKHKRKVSMFRCSRFYRLYEEYINDLDFKKLIDKKADLNVVQPIDIIADIAGYKEDLLMGVEYSK